MRGSWRGCAGRCSRRVAYLSLGSAGIGVARPRVVYRVIELWESREAFQEWYESHIAPNLPPGAETTPPEFSGLSLELKPQP